MRRASEVEQGSEVGGRGRRAPRPGPQAVEQPAAVPGEPGRAVATPDETGRAITTPPPAPRRSRVLARQGVDRASEGPPAKGGRPRAHREALAEMYLAFRDGLLAHELARGSGCWSALYWQATQESPTADARAKVGALMNLLSELARLVDAWCEQVDVAVDPITAPGEPPELEGDAAVAQRVRDVAGWFDRSARAIRVGAAEMKYLASELEGASSARRAEAEPFRTPERTEAEGQGQGQAPEP